MSERRDRGASTWRDIRGAAGRVPRRNPQPPRHHRIVPFARYFALRAHFRRHRTLTGRQLTVPL